MDEQGPLLEKLITFLLLRKYEPAERIPSERELALRFRVGRGNVREALAYLEALRIIQRRAKSGIYMAPETASFEALAFLAQSGIPLDAADIRDTVEMRQVHETAAIQWACERATPDNLAALRTILDRTEAKIARKQPVNEEDRDFHLEIVRATQNGVFFRIVKIFYHMTEKRRLVYFQDPRRCKASHAEHLKIYKALQKRDAKTAVKLVNQHLQGVDSYWKDLIGQDTSSERAHYSERTHPKHEVS